MAVFVRANVTSRTVRFPYSVVPWSQALPEVLMSTSRVKASAAVWLERRTMAVTLQATAAERLVGVNEGVMDSVCTKSSMARLLPKVRGRAGMKVPKKVVFSFTGKFAGN